MSVLFWLYYCINKIMHDLNYRDLNKLHIIPFKDEISRISAKITHNLTFGIEDIKLVKLLTKIIQTYENLKKHPLSTLEDIIGENNKRNIPIAHAVQISHTEPSTLRLIKSGLPSRPLSPESSDSDNEKMENLVDLFSLNPGEQSDSDEEYIDEEGDLAIKQMNVTAGTMLSYITNNKWYQVEEHLSEDDDSDEDSTELGSIGTNESIVSEEFKDLCDEDFHSARDREENSDITAALKDAGIDEEYFTSLLVDETIPSAPLLTSLSPPPPEAPLLTSLSPPPLERVVDIDMHEIPKSIEHMYA